MQPNVSKVQMALCGVGLLENFLYLWLLAWYYSLFRLLAPKL